MIREGSNVYLRRMFKRYGPVYSEALLGRKTVMVGGYSDVKRLLGAEHELVEGGHDC